MRSFGISRLSLLSVALSGLVLMPGCTKKETTDRPAGLPPGAAAPAPAAPAPAAAPGSPPAVPPAAPHGSGAAPQDEAETAPSAPDPKATISGTLTLPKARAKDVSKGDTLFLVARRAGGPPGPGSMIAVQKLQVGDFPMPFTLSARDAMIPGTPFEGEISITARVDKDGDPITRKKGDVFGAVNAVKVGTQNVVLPLETLQTEDKSLAGPGAMPPGHP